MSLREKLAKLRFDMNHEQEEERAKYVLDQLRGAMKKKVEKDISLKIKQRYQELLVKDLKFETLALYDHFMKEKGMCYYYSNRRPKQKVNMSEVMGGKMHSKKKQTLQDSNEHSLHELSASRLGINNSTQQGVYLKKELSKAGLAPPHKFCPQHNSLTIKKGYASQRVSPKGTSTLGELDKIILQNVKESHNLSQESVQPLPDFKQFLEDFKKLEKTLQYKHKTKEREEEEEEEVIATNEGQKQRLPSLEYLRKFRKVLQEERKWKTKHKGLVGVQVDFGEEVDILRREKMAGQGRIGRFRIDMQEYQVKDREREKLEKRVTDMLHDNQLDDLVKNMELFIGNSQDHIVTERSKQSHSVTPLLEPIQKERVPASRLLQMAMIDNIINDCSGYMEGNSGISVSELDQRIADTNKELEKRHWVVKKLLKVNQRVAPTTKLREMSQDIFQDQGESRKLIQDRMDDYFEDQIKLEGEIYELNRQGAWRMKMDDGHFWKKKPKKVKKMFKLPNLA